MMSTLQIQIFFKSMTSYIVFRQHRKAPMSRPSDFQAQLQRLLEKQKIARVNNEHMTSVTVLKDIITLCQAAGQWAKLNEQITYLMNRRGQSKKAQIDMIQLAMTWLPGTPEPQRTTLIETLRDVSAKKIFLEVEYARCVMLIVRSKENDNDIFEAAMILQQVQVETYGSMDKREKLEFILYQMNIMLKKKDYVRFYIISKKINENNINEPAIADLKVMFYSFMAIYYNHEKNYPQACRCYRLLDQTISAGHKEIPQVLDFGFSAKKLDVLGNYVAFLALQPYSQANHTELTKISEQEDMQGHEAFMRILKNFLSEEIVPCQIEQYSTASFQLFRPSFPNQQHHLSQLKRMLVQHNIRIVSKYYGQLSMDRLSQLLEVQKEYCEQELCNLNTNKTISCRVDRIDGVIDFRPVQNEQYLLKGWNSSINGILDLVDMTTNLIHREREVYKK